MSSTQKGALPASTTGSAPCSVCRGSCVPVFQLRTGHGFPRTSLRKLHPVLNVDSGIPFPQWASCGNGIPLRAPIPGHSFPTAPVSETTSHFEPFKAGRGFPERVSTTYRRRPGLHRACVELQHAAAVFVHGELGALQAAALTRSQLGRVDLVAIGLLGQQDAPRPRCGHRCGRSLPRSERRSAIVSSVGKPSNERDHVHARSAARARARAGSPNRDGRAGCRARRMDARQPLPRRRPARHRPRGRRAARAMASRTP